MASLSISTSAGTVSITLDEARAVKIVEGAAHYLGHGSGSDAEKATACLKAAGTHLVRLAREGHERKSADELADLGQDLE
jgi:hypothetical protein